MDRMCTQLSTFRMSAALRTHEPTVCCKHLCCVGVRRELRDRTARATASIVCSKHFTTCTAPFNIFQGTIQAVNLLIGAVRRVVLTVRVPICREGVMCSAVWVACGPNY
jgi:hypothetical protein